MNRQEFMYHLDVELSKLPEDERQAALAYYREYFDEAGPEREQEAIRELGSPEKIAAQIKGDYAVCQLEGPGMGKPPQKKMRILLWAVLGIFAAPIAFPVALVMGICALAFLICLFAVAFSLIVSFGATCLGGITLVGVGIGGLAGSVAGGTMLIGMGLASAGVTAILCVGVIIGFRALVRFLAKRMPRNDRRKAQQLEKEEQ